MQRDAKKPAKARQRRRLQAHEALGAISARHSGRQPSTKESFVVPQDDCLEMYYYLGIARDEMGQ